MCKIIECEMDQKRITITEAEGENLPVVYCVAQSDHEILQACNEISCKKFHLVTIEKVDWNENLSPWAADSVVTKDDGFSGRGAEFLQWIFKKVVPLVDETLRKEQHVSYIAGYSMAGLFALWSLYQTDYFNGAVCASGSLWFPAFEEYVLTNEMKASPKGIYLSLGDRESAGRNPVLKKTETIYRNLFAFFIQQEQNVFFEMNQGNHFKDVDLRLAKGLTWLLDNSRKKEEETQ